MRATWLVLLVAACETGDPPDLTAKLVARYPMDDLVSGKASDISGNNHHGMCSTCPGVDAAGKSLAAFHFDGGDQQIDVPPDAAFNAVTRGVSASVWVKLDIAPPAIPGCALVKGAMWSICVTPALQPAFGSFNATATLAVGTWHHLAVTYDGKTKRVLVDGTEVGTQAGAILSETGGLSIGPELIGSLDEAQVFEGVLTDEEIADLMTP